MTTFNRQSKIGGLRITRKEGEVIIVNNGEIVIEVTEIRGKRVKLSLKGHKEIAIRRGESQELSPQPPPGER